LIVGRVVASNDIYYSNHSNLKLDVEQKTSPAVWLLACETARLLDSGTVGLQAC
jgi:hypothetical protein